MPNSYAATNTKKFLDANGLAHFAQRLNQYPTNDVIEAVVEGIQDALDEKLDENKVGQANGVASLDANGKVPNSQLPTDANTTYTITQDQTDGHKFTLTGTDGSSTTITIPDENTTYSTATQSTEGLMSSTDKKKLDGIAAGATDNLGTITGITMNGVSKGVAGVVDLGTVLTEHQDISGKLNASLKGVANGVADLDENGHVPSSQLPSYVDDVLEYNGRASFPVTGEAGKIYVDISEDGGNKTYRWSGSLYIEISPSLTLGTTPSTAFRGDHGSAAYTHAVTNKGSAFESGLYKITTNAEGHVTAATPVVKSDLTSLGIPSTNTTYTFDGTYNASTNKAATVQTVTDAISTLDGGTIGTGGAGKTITALSQTDGNVSATFGNISITKAQVSDLGTIGTAAAKGVDTSIADASASTNLPTSQAVAAFVEGKGYETTNTTYTISQDIIDGHTFTLTGSDGTSTTITIPDNDTTYTLLSLGIEHVKNFDQSKAIKSITRNGTTFTYTCLDNTTGTFTQQDNNTWIAMIGATSSADGAAGYVPAPPSDGYNTKYLRADGTWNIPFKNNPVTFVLDTVTNTSGTYSHTTSAAGATATMKAIGLECSNSNAFADVIQVTMQNGSILLECNNVIGTSAVSVIAVEIDENAGAVPVTASEFSILSERIGDITHLSTTTKASTVSAINEIHQNVNEISQDTNVLSDSVENMQAGLCTVCTGDTWTGGSTLYANTFVYVKNNSTLTEGLYKTNTNITPGGSLSDKLVAVKALDELQSDMKENLFTYVMFTINSSMPGNFMTSQDAYNHQWDNCIVVHIQLSNPSAQCGDWVCDLSADSITLSGASIDSTTACVYIMKASQGGASYANNNSFRYILPNPQIVADNAGAHNGIYRGKCLGTSVSSAQYEAIADGTFKNLYLGDYWTIGGHNWVICDFDYYIRCGSVDVNQHHLVMMPSGNMNIPAGTALYGTSDTLTLLGESATAKKWNATSEDASTHSTAGGYKYSRMRTVIMKAANTIVINAFGSSHVLPFTELYYSPAAATGSGLASGWAWFDNDSQSDIMCKSICDLCNETMVYGQQVWGRGSAYTNVGYEIGIDKFQLAIFALNRNFANIRSSWWLRSVSSATGAADVGNYGYANNIGSANALGVRPRFLLVG